MSRAMVGGPPIRQDKRIFGQFRFKNSLENNGSPNALGVRPIYQNYRWRYIWEQRENERQRVTEKKAIFATIRDSFEASIYDIPEAENKLFSGKY
jgi:hypothetical protein